MNARSPVLFLVFNRPDTTARVFETIRQAHPPRLYVAADGPRASRPGEADRCEAVRRLATAVDWPCELKTLLRHENLGCKRAVSSGISWFFEHEPEGIVLEDDCLPDPSFFTYCDALLEHYRDDPRVMCISGDNFIAGHWSPQDSYYFSRFAHIWGWASWRRAWQHYDVALADWPTQRESGLLRRLLPGMPRLQAHWCRALDAVAAGKIDTWDYQWAYACFRHGGLSCMPAVNLISNIGFGTDATRTTNPEGKLANLPACKLALPLTHPVEVRANDAADRWTGANVFEIDERRINPRRWVASLRRRLGALAPTQRA
jgi:hypothetical protein